MPFTVVPHSTLGPLDLVLVIVSEALVAEHHVKYSSSVREFQPYFPEGEEPVALAALIDAERQGDDYPPKILPRHSIPLPRVWYCCSKVDFFCRE